MVKKMSKKKIVSTPIPVSKWPALDRNGAIVSRMTSDPQPTEIHLVVAKHDEEEEP